MTALLLSLPLLALLSAAVVRGMIARPLLDRPDGRKAHARPTPTAGGVGVAAAVAAGMALLWAAGDPGPAQHAALLGAALAMAALGLLDDKLDLPPLPRLFGQAAAAAVAMAGGLVLETIALPFLGPVPLGALGPVITLLWFLVCTNAVNFLDGADGLTGGSLIVSCLMLALVGLALGAPFVVALSLCLAAGLAGFLPFNWPPARIFLGDVGSQGAGFLLAGLGVAAALAAEARMSFAIVPLLLAAQLFDACFTVARRALAGERFWQPHRSHLFQMAIRSGWPVVRVARLHIGFAAWHGLLALWFLTLPPEAKPLPLLVALMGQLFWLWVVLRAMRRASLGFSIPP
ncbi:MAG: undecaprenyl/decaprenyl-phosphate alpha-N-acetylglucosaminyl 1-phosphate transferase [Acetobacteraceae bacterium]|nr:undecaprenyl/decaprenyl-phosphate alpha-N-acetylglucosaminyl 1-phosphate transferase [Acetobacteraceae bacterium]MDW8398105.1 MraY family glycosyltransferase [Acetobacteraceae bacterium]